MKEADQIDGHSAAFHCKNIARTGNSLTSDDGATPSTGTTASDLDSTMFQNDDAFISSAASEVSEICTINNEHEVAGASSGEQFERRIKEKMQLFGTKPNDLELTSASDSEMKMLQLPEQNSSGIARDNIRTIIPPAVFGSFHGTEEIDRKIAEKERQLECISQSQSTDSISVSSKMNSVRSNNDASSIAHGTIVSCYGTEDIDQRIAEKERRLAALDEIRCESLTDPSQTKTKAASIPTNDSTTLYSSHLAIPANSLVGSFHSAEEIDRKIAQKVRQLELMEHSSTATSPLQGTFECKAANGSYTSSCNPTTTSYTIDSFPGSDEIDRRIAEKERQLASMERSNSVPMAISTVPVGRNNTDTSAYHHSETSQKSVLGPYPTSVDEIDRRINEKQCQLAVIDQLRSSDPSHPHISNSLAERIIDDDCMVDEDNSSLNLSPQDLENRILAKEMELRSLENERYIRVSDSASAAVPLSPTKRFRRQISTSNVRLDDDTPEHQKPSATRPGVASYGDPSTDEFGHDASFPGDNSNDYNDENLAIALPINDNDDDNSRRVDYLPAAIQFDPDEKNNIRRTSQGRTVAIFVALVAVTAVIALAIGITIGMRHDKTHNNDDTVPAYPSSYLQIQELIRISMFNSVNTTTLSDRFADVNDPYRKALDWLVYVDPLQLDSDSPSLLSRYLLAYFYFETSSDRPWQYCAPATMNVTNVSSPSPCRLNEIYEDGTINTGDFATDGSIRPWLSGGDSCEWAGVSCDQKGHVESLNLGAFNMTGSFPQALKFMPFLLEFEFSVNELRGPLPPTEWKYLQTAKMGFSDVSGPLPTNWMKSRSIDRIFLRSNQLTGSLLPDLSISLRRIDISSNYLTGTIPVSYEKNKNFRSFEIGRNSFEGLIPSGFFVLQNLQYFKIEENAFTGTIPTIVDLPSLTRLYIQSNNFTGKLPESLLYDAGPALFHMKASDNSFQGTLSTLLGTLTFLRILELSNNGFAGTVPTELGMLTNLLSLSLSGNMLEGTVPSDLCSLRGFNLASVSADCLGDIPQIVCDEDCCTTCCDPSTRKCQDL